MCVRELEQKLTHACGFIGVRPSNDCKSELIDTPSWSLLKPEALQPLPWKWEGPQSVSLTMQKKMQTSYHADLVPAKGNVVTDRSVGNTVDGETLASIDKNGTSFQEPRSVNLGGKISYPCKLNCCRYGNKSCTQFCGVWICDLIVRPPCIAKLSCRKLIALNSVSMLDLQQSPPNLHL